jgi:3-phenylpropionate/trans-cinnamate dioxygenase ferredoxin subunit
MAVDRARFTRACGLSELEEDTPKRVELDGTPVSVVYTEGEVEDCQIECWLHGSAFDLRTGKPSGLPATRPVPVYPVQIEGDDVLVSLSQES